LPGGGGGYDRNVFVNCPFDDDFRPILEAIVFCVIDCGMAPRLSSERLDAESRLDKIVELISESRFSIHDLSRVRAERRGEFARLNMPFELGVDYGFSRSGGRFSTKRALVIAKEPYEYQVALSDIAGFDIASHHDSYEQAMKHVRRWLRSQGVEVRSPTQIVGDYLAFQEWDWVRLLDEGWDEDDIPDRSTDEHLDAMELWVRSGRPLTDP
jgi:hypothetical protein